MGEAEPAATRNLRLVLAYDGGGFHGWQRQVGAPTVQEAVERKLQQITGLPAAVNAAGRTDAGVHAVGQVVNFHTAARIPTERVAVAFNSVPPYTVTARDARETAAEFHARFHAVRRTYRYYLWRGSRNPFLDRYTCPAPDLQAALLERIREALPAFEGTHDFTSFCAAGAETENRVRTVYRAILKEKGPLVVLTITANGFLQGMVRIVMGTLLEVARGKRQPEEISAVLLERDRRYAGETAPAKGLFLTRVDYNIEGDETGCRSPGQELLQ